MATVPSSDDPLFPRPIRASDLLRRGWGTFRAHGLRVMGAYLVYLVLTGAACALVRAGWEAWGPASSSGFLVDGVNVYRLLGAVGTPTWRPTTVGPTQVDALGRSLGSMLDALLDGSFGMLLPRLSPDLGAALVVWAVVAGPAAVGLYGAVLRLARTGTLSLRAAGPALAHYGTAVGTFLAAGLLQIGGFTLLLAPGFVAMAAHLPVFFRVADGASSVRDALAWAWTHTRGTRWALFTTYMALWVLGSGPALLRIGLKHEVFNRATLPLLGPTTLITGLLSLAVGAYGLCVVVQGYEAVRAKAA